MTVAVQVLDTLLIAAPESLAISPALILRHTRVAILIAIVYVGLAMIVEVLVCALDSIVKSLALNFLVPRGRHIPSGAILSSRCGNTLSNTAGPGFLRGDYHQRKCKH